MPYVYKYPRPAVVYQDGRLGFQYKANMVDVGQGHCLLLLFNDILSLATIIIIRIFLMQLIQLTVDFTFKSLDCIKPVLGNRA